MTDGKGKQKQMSRTTQTAEERTIANELDVVHRDLFDVGNHKGEERREKKRHKGTKAYPAHVGAGHPVNTMGVGRRKDIDTRPLSATALRRDNEDLTLIWLERGGEIGDAHGSCPALTRVDDARQGDDVTAERVAEVTVTVAMIADARIDEAQRGMCAIVVPDVV